MERVLQNKKKSCRLFLIFGLLWTAFNAYAFDEKTRVAFYYADNPPIEELHAFNVVVVNAGSHISPKTYNNAASELYAYISVGEADKGTSYSHKIKAGWKKGSNPAWNSDVMDLANPEWRNFLINEQIEALWQEGYRGFFLDTLDSWQLLKLNPEQKLQQQAGLVAIIKDIKLKHPEAKVIANRGFEVLAKVHESIDAIAAESLFAGWNPASKAYMPVSENNRNYLLQELNVARQKYHLPVIVIDYLPPAAREQAREVAKKIHALGFMPWISDPGLETLGLGTVEVMPRRIFLLYDEDPAEGIASLPLYYTTAFLLQYMGYIPVLQKVDKSLPQKNLADRYAGILIWFNKPLIKEHALLEKWLTAQLEYKIPFVFLDNFGISPKAPLFRALGITEAERAGNISKVQIVSKNEHVGFEILPQPTAVDFTPLTMQGGEAWLTFRASNNQREDAISIGNWGGYAIGGYTFVGVGQNRLRWAINPFVFLKAALHLPDFPIPDVTTENGNRILTVHIDGDAFVNRISWQEDAFAGELIYEEILKKYSLPTTVSFIEREFELFGDNLAIVERLVKVVQKIAALPWVELATHTYSHPLIWQNLVEGQLNTKLLSYPSPVYAFNYQKEITGSRDFINKIIASSGKKVRTVFWSGDADLLEKPLEVAKEAGLKNINGKAVVMINRYNSVSNMGPMGIRIGKYYQVFAPISNDFEFTDKWDKPYYAVENVIHNFKLTEKPMRFKPMSLYYHFYAAAEQSSLHALKRTYAWVVKQQTTPLQIQDYINRVLAFNQLAIAKSILDPAQWLIANNGDLKTLRWPLANGYPNLETSQNVAGFNQANADIYIHLGNLPDTWISFTAALPQKPYLVEANAILKGWQTVEHPLMYAGSAQNSAPVLASSFFDLLIAPLLKTAENRSIREISFKGYVPLQFKLANMNGCQVRHNNQILEMTPEGSYLIKGAHGGTFAIHCGG